MTREEAAAIIRKSELSAHADAIIVKLLPSDLIEAKQVPLGPQTAISGHMLRQAKTETAQSQGEGNREKIKESLTIPALPEDKNKVCR